MLSSDAISPASPSDAVAPRVVRSREMVLLSKPGITRLVTIASGVGFIVAAAWHQRPLGELIIPGLGCVIGTAIASAGANAFNQVLEIGRDGLMQRTAGRPLPAGRLTPGAAWIFAFACSILGPLLLGVTSNWIAAAIALLTIVLYAAVYTPLKPISPVSTYVGAIPGALPCLIGWAAATRPEAGSPAIGPALSVFAILLVWQLPHFFAIAMMYRDQYERAGFRPVPTNASAAQIGRWVVAWAGATVAASALPLIAMPGLIGGAYAAVAAIAGAAFVYVSVLLMQQPSGDSARRVFFASIAYLPAVYFALVFDAVLGYA